MNYPPNDHLLFDMRALLIGNFSQREFQSLPPAIRKVATIRVANDCRDAIRWLESEPGDVGAVDVDVVIVAERWPGEHPHRELERVQRALPLARFLAVGSSWCEGQARSGNPWPGMLYQGWNSWWAHWEMDLTNLRQQRLPSFGLPVIASDHERTLFRTFPPRSKDQMIAIHTHCEDMADMLATACRDQGYATVWIDPQRPLRIERPQAILWEGSPDHLDSLQRIHSRFRQAPLLALLDFPRFEDVARAIDMGASEILPKPTHLEDLFHRLASLLSDPQTAQKLHRAAS